MRHVRNIRRNSLRTVFPKTSLQVWTGDLAKEKAWPQTGSAAWVHGPLAVDEAVSWCGVTKDIVQDLGKPWAEPLVGHAHHARRGTFRFNAMTARTKKSNYRPVSLDHWRQIGQALHEPLSWRVPTNLGETMAVGQLSPFSAVCDEIGCFIPHVCR